MGKQILKTTILKGLRPLFNNQTESIQRFHEIAVFFNTNKEYLLFAEPVFTPNSNDLSIDWRTDFEGEAIEYDKLSEDDKILAKGILKREINQLYHIAYYLTPESKNRDRILSILDNAIEIPDINNIFLIRDDYNKTHVVVTSWGFIGESYNAQTGIIKKLVPVKVKNIVFKIFLKNKKKAINEDLTFDFLGKSRVLTSDSNGEITIFDLPFATPIKISNKLNDSDNVLFDNICGKEDSYSIIINKDGEPPILQIQTLNKDGLILRDIELECIWGSVKKKFVSDKNGIIELHDLAFNTDFECYQEKDGIKINYHTFRTVVGQVIYNVVISESFPVMALKKIYFLKPNGKKLSKVKAQIVEGIRFKDYISGKDGTLILEDYQDGDNLEVTAKKGFYKGTHSILIEKELFDYPMILKRKIPFWFWLIWIVLFAVIAGYLVWLYLIPPKKAEVPEPVTIKIIDSVSLKPVSKALLVINGSEIKDMKKVSDSKGMVSLGNLGTEPKQLTIKTSASNYEISLKNIKIEPSKKKNYIIKVLSIKDGGLLGETGDIKINLKWFNTDDLDLYVIDPCGNRIFYKNRQMKCKGKTGKLDVDANGSTSPSLTNKPQENIFWETASKGLYKVYIQNNKNRNGTAVRYILSIKTKNRLKTKRGQINKPGKMEFITTISYQ